MHRNQFARPWVSVKFEGNFREVWKIFFANLICINSSFSYRSFEKIQKLERWVKLQPRISANPALDNLLQKFGFIKELVYNRVRGLYGVFLGQSLSPSILKIALLNDVFNRTMLVIITYINIMFFFYFLISCVVSTLPFHQNSVFPASDSLTSCGISLYYRGGGTKVVFLKYSLKGIGNKNFYCFMRKSMKK